MLTGKSSFVVTLPKEWVENNKLKKKQEIYFLTLDDGSLLLTPYLNKKKYRKLLKVTKDISHLKRLIYATYLGGYSEMKISSDSSIDSETRSEIKQISNALMGVEVGEETPDSMTLKNMVQDSGINFQDIISTMMEMTLSMFESAFKALKNRDETTAQFVVDRDKEVNPKNHAITRIMNTYLQDLTLTQSLGVSLIEAQSNFALSMFLESLADFAVLISRNIINMLEQGIDIASISEIVKIGTKYTEIMTQIFFNWKNDNKDGVRQPLDESNVYQANLYLDQLGVVKLECAKLMERFRKQSINSYLYVILEKIQQSIKTLSNIALISIDIVEGKLPQD